MHRLRWAGNTNVVALLLTLFAASKADGDFVALNSISEGNERGTSLSQYVLVQEGEFGALVTSAQGGDIIVIPPPTRFALEFDLAGIPAGSQIHSAILKFSETEDRSTNALVVLHGFPGNGIVESTDFVVSHVLLQNISNNQVDPSVSLDVSPFIQSLVDSGHRYGGFTVAEEPIVSFPSPWSVTYSIFDSRGNPANAPLLLIDFTPIPEPSSFTLIALGLGAVVCWRSRTYRAISAHR